MKNKYVVIGIISLIIVLLVVGVIYLLNDNKDNEKLNNTNTEKIENSIENKINNEEKENMNNNVKHHAEIVVKNYGTIKVELDEKNAPITVENFIKLANEGFYNGLTFHRIISGFMIQGGDPLGDGTGGAKENIKGEFYINGVNNEISHKRGVISMARSQMYDSASSQFFIVHEDSEFLDGQYAGFGKVTNGMEVVDKICENIKVEDNNGKVLKENQPIIERVTILD